MANPAPATPRDYVPGLDGLRAVSITLVILGHLGFGALVPGGLGVTVFFFISGFLITRLLFAERERNGRVDLWRFYGRRTLRLAPELLAFILITGLVLAPVLRQPLPPLQALAALTYWTNYFILSGAGDCTGCATTGHLWSLAVEEHFYLVMPLAMIACAFAPRRLVWLFVAVGVAAAAWRFTAFTRLGLSEIYTYKATECRIDAIGWGCLAAVIARRWPAARELLLRRAWSVFAAGCVLMLASLAWRDEVFRATFRYSVQAVALVGIVLPLTAAAARMGGVVRALEWAPLRWMGRRSYAAYLWHYTALYVSGLAVGYRGGDMEAAPHAIQLIVLPLVLAGTWLAAEISHRLVYKPSQRLKPWLEPRRGPSPAPDGEPVRPLVVQPG